jgi:methylthioribose-1-phosphate isomerase
LGRARAGYGKRVFRPLRFDDGALLVLDQRRLPAEETWLRCERPEQVAEAIRTLAVRGAPAIGLAAAYGLALTDDPDGAAELLRSTRPTAVDLTWIPIEERDPAEVADGAAPAGAEAFNPAFDVTPAELVGAIFTEAGVLEPPYPEAIAAAVRA